MEVLVQFTSVNTSASSALRFLNGLSSMHSLAFDIDLKNNNMLQLTKKAISAHMIVKYKYEDTWNVGILFDYCRGKGLNRNLKNIELQTKLTSLLMTICSLRPAEIEGISQGHSVICEQADKVDLQLQPKTKSGLHLHILPKNRDRTVCPRAIFFDWLKRIDNKHGRSIRDNKYGALWWNEDITIPAKRGQISLRLKKLLDLMGIKGKQVYSFRHSAATQLVVIGSGTSGRVYLVRHAEFGVIAAKVIKADKFDQREWDAAGAISNPGFQCPFVLKYHVAKMAGDSIVILMEYANAK
ncbi:MAG: hypothetical protein EZS28_028404, partial [Streblomastix strix]